MIFSIQALFCYLCEALGRTSKERMFNNYDHCNDNKDSNNRSKGIKD